MLHLNAPNGLKLGFSLQNTSHLTSFLSVKPTSACYSAARTTTHAAAHTAVFFAHRSPDCAAACPLFAPLPRLRSRLSRCSLRRILSAILFVIGGYPSPTLTQKLPDMPRSKRHAPRCQSTRIESPTEPKGAFDVTGHSEPVPEVPYGQSDPSMQLESSTQTNLPSSKKKSNRYWTVDLIDENGGVKEARFRVQDVFVLSSGQKVVLEWNEDRQPIGEAAGLLKGFLGHVASNFNNFPINYEKWSKIPSSYKEHVWSNLIKVKFQVFDSPNKTYIMKKLRKKWKENRIRLFHENYDPTLSWETNVERYPRDVSRDQWASFLIYRLSEKTKEELHMQTQSNNEGGAYINVLGKEHPGCVRGMEFSVDPSKILGSASRSAGCSSSSCQLKVTHEAEIKEIKDKLETYNARVNKIERTLAYVLEYVGAPLPPGFPSTDQDADLSSLVSTNLRRSPSGSYELENHDPTSPHS